MKIKLEKDGNIKFADDRVVIEELKELGWKSEEKPKKTPVKKKPAKKKED